MNSKNHYDLIIIGSGIVGLTLAYKLRATSLRIALIDQSKPTITSADSITRVSALTPASRAVLSELPLWETPLGIFDKMHVWTPAGAALDFNAAAIGAQALGYIVANQTLQTDLQHVLQIEANITFIAPAQLRALVADAAGVTVTLDTGVTLTARLVIGADGANSRVRALSNIALQQHAYDQQGIVATIALEKTHQNTAWQLFLAEGPLAVLPLANPHSASIVWSTSTLRAAELNAQAPAVFAKELGKALSHRFGALQLMSGRASYALQCSHAERYIKPGVALIGDAAHTLHPLAGQGLNLGIADAAYLADVITLAHHKKRDIASYVTLRKYERARRADNSLMLNVVDNLNRLFGNEAAPIKFLRETGMDWLNHLPGLKHYLIRQAAGVRT